MRTDSWKQLGSAVAICSAVAVPVFADAVVDAASPEVPKASVPGLAPTASGGNHRSPHILGSLPPSTMLQLKRAYAWARKRAPLPACQSLFHELNAEPLAVLSRASYTEPITPSEEATCRRRRAAAFTSVGPGRTVLCPGFVQVDVSTAAAYLLHEALHNAGQTEWPSDPEAPTSAQIQQRVREECRL